MRKSYGDLRQLWPVTSGLIEGFLFVIAIAFAVGLFHGISLQWALALVVLTGFRRPFAYQAALAILPAIASAFLEQVPLMALLVPVALAILIANSFIRTERGERWGIEHAAFGVAALSTYTVAQLFFLAPEAVLLRSAATLLLLLSCTVLTAARRAYVEMKGPRTREEFTIRVTRPL